MQLSPLSIPLQPRPLSICKRPSDTSRLECGIWFVTGRTTAFLLHLTSHPNEGYSSG